MKHSSWELDRNFITCDCDHGKHFPTMSQEFAVVVVQPGAVVFASRLAISRPLARAARLCWFWQRKGGCSGDFFSIIVGIASRNRFQSCYNLLKVG